jgi:asparagine N-glycosylation enzyme membrane subunit Stt3
MSNTNNTGRNIFSVVAGVITSSLLFMLAGLIMLLFLASKVKGHGEESDFEKTTDTVSIGMIAALFICCLLGGFVTGRISTKNDVIHGSITAAVLILLLASISNFRFNSSDIINYLLIIPFTLTGTLLAIRMKKRRKRY